MGTSIDMSVLNKLNKEYESYQTTSKNMLNTGVTQQKESISPNEKHNIDIYIGPDDENPTYIVDTYENNNMKKELTFKQFIIKDPKTNKERNILERGISETKGDNKRLGQIWVDKDNGEIIDILGDNSDLGISKEKGWDIGEEIAKDEYKSKLADSLDEKPSLQFYYRNGEPSQKQ